MLRLAFVRRTVFSLCVAMGLLLAASATRADAPHVVVLPTTGIVDQVMAGYIRDGIAQAARDGASAVILQIDTPGGSLESTREIVKTILEAPIPVITWVSPAGSRAASAGTFITLAGAVALMAPATNIGAASPVDASGGDIPGTLGTKVMNDAVASITAIAEERGRNVAWAVSAVKDAKSSPASEAVAMGAVDGIAGSLQDVLAFADGRQVKVSGATVTLHLAGATTSEIGMNPLQGFLHLLADPNIAFILFTVGSYGLILEVMHPNMITGTLGAVSIVLAFIGFGSLPINIGGLLLIVLAIALFAFDVTVTNHGVPTAGGVLAFVLGAAALYSSPGSPTGPDVGVAWPIIAVMAGATLLFMGFVVRAAYRIRRMSRLPIGLGGGAGGTLPPGVPGEVRRPLTPIGSVFLGGEEWTARTRDGQPLERGTSVRTVGQDGLVLIVERADPSGSGHRLEVSPS